jgi:DNA-binding IclR family transcriptional regulator
MAQLQGSGSTSRKLLAVLFCFSQDKPVRTVEDISQELGLPRSSVYRFLSILREVMLVEEAAAGRYQLGPRALALGQAARSRLTILDVVRPVTAGLAEETGETVLFVRSVGDGAVCLDRVETKHRLRLSFEVGQVLPLHSGAVAKVLLAYAPGDRRKNYLRSHRSEVPPGRDLERELETLLDSGYAESEGEVDPGVWAIAAPVRLGNGEVYGLSTVVPVIRLDDRTRAQIREATLRAAARLESLISINGPRT